MSRELLFYLPDPDDMSTTIEFEWIEIRCAFPIEMSPIIPWLELRDAVHGWKASGLLNRFFFVRKPPGLRLRFERVGPPTKFVDGLYAWLDLMSKKHLLEQFHKGAYEPEAHRFGGDDGMGIAHDYWSNDTEIVLDYECLSEGSRGAIPRTALWGTLLNHLLGQTLDDNAEAWDVWCRLDEAFSDLDARSPQMETIYKSAAPGMLAGPEVWNALFPQTLNAVLVNAKDSNTKTANQLKKLSEQGRLGVGVRSWLTANALFQANRWGLGMNALELRAASIAMREYLEPDARKEVHSSNG